MEQNTWGSQLCQHSLSAFKNQNLGIYLLKPEEIKVCGIDYCITTSE